MPMVQVSAYAVEQNGQYSSSVRQQVNLQTADRQMTSNDTSHCKQIHALQLLLLLTISLPPLSGVHSSRQRPYSERHAR